MTDASNFTIIRLSGRTEFKPDTDYYAVLASIYHEYRSAGGNWDRPNMLLFNGRVVASEGIADIAWEYGERERALHELAFKKIREEFRPAWLPAALKEREGE